MTYCPIAVQLDHKVSLLVRAIDRAGPGHLVLLKHHFAHAGHHAVDLDRMVRSRRRTGTRVSFGSPPSIEGVYRVSKEGMLYQEKTY